MDNDIHYIRKELDRLQYKLNDFTVDTYYATGSNDTTIPATGWSKTKPSASAGVFIWVKNTIHTPYGDLNLMPFCLGDGVSHILSIVNYYLTTDNAFDVPVPYPQNTNWQTTAPILTTGHFMWTMQKIATTQGDTYTSPVRITGEKGEKGADGLSIKGDSSYLHIRYSDLNNPISSSHVFTEPNRFIGMYIDTTMETQDNKSTYDNPSLYSWRLFKPTAGIDYDDKFLHMKYAESVTFTGDTVTNIVYTGNTGEDAGDWLGVLFDTNPQDPQIYSSGTTVDYTVANSFTWKKITGEDGGDGNGEETVYCLTQDATAPTKPTASTVIYNIDDTSGEATTGLWYSSPLEVSESFQCCWACKRFQVEGVFSAYQNPILHSYYVRDGLNGDDGKDGKDGKDGTELTGDDIMTMISGQNIDAQSIGGISIDGLMTTQVYSATINDKNGNANCTVMKMGRLCIINFVSYICNIGSTSNLYYTFASLPTWAYPISTMHTLVIPNYTEIVRIGNTGDIGVRTTNHSVGDLVNISGTFVYFAQENVTLKTTSLSFDNTTVTYSNPVTVTLKRTDESNTLVPFADTSVEFEINSRVYTRQTDSNGKASLDISLPHNSTAYPMTVRFRGDSVNASTTASQNITVNAVSNATWDTTGEYPVLKSSSKGLPTVPCKITINSDVYYQNTDYNGKIDLTSILSMYKGSVTPKIETNDTNRCNYTYATMNYTGTKSTEIYTKILTPTDIANGTSTGVSWSVNTGNVAVKNDGSYAKAYNIASGSKYKDLVADCSGFNIPNGAVVKSVTVYMRYASLLGQTTMSKGNFSAPIFQLRVNGSTRTGDYAIGTAMSRTQCGEWRDEQVWIGITEADGLQVDGKWNSVGVHINAGTNGGGGYGNNASFGLDYLAIKVEYEG